MKKVVGLRIIWIVLLLFTLNLVLANNNIYQQDSLELQLDVNGKFELIAIGDNANAKSASAELLLYPTENFRQELINWKSEGILDETVKFSWLNPALGVKSFSFSSLVKTNNQRREVPSKISFPLTAEKTKGLEEYLQPTETIDSDNPEIIAKATELVEGEDDLFKAVFNLASWVEENIEYDLNTLTATASQKGSWVLENREGVCDEMTSLFVAMARAVGIPARFVFGISYTTSDLFDKNWQPHGWSEVYFPDLGWISFDITFNQYGYIDVTHIKLRDGFDPAEPAVKYEWLANNVNLKSKELNLDVIISKEGNLIPEEISLRQEILAKEVDLGSYNLIKGIIKNKADYYTATALNLALPKEVEIIGRNRRNILLHPKEVRETYWVVKLPDDLKENFIYTFPTTIYSEKNISASDFFISQKNKAFYSKSDVEELTIENEEKSYSQKISFTCNYLKEIKLNEENIINCTIKNTGNTNLMQINFCLNEICKLINLPLNQENFAEITIHEKEAGWEKIIVSAKNKMIEKKISLEYVVIDDPNLKVETDYPLSTNYGESFQLKLNLEKKSFTEPQEVVLIISGPWINQEWNIKKLIQSKEIVLDIEGTKIVKNNQYSIKTIWKDKEGKEYSNEDKVIIIGKAQSFNEKLKLWINWFLSKL